MHNFIYMEIEINSLFLKDVNMKENSPYFNLFLIGEKIILVFYYLLIIFFNPW